MNLQQEAPKAAQITPLKSKNIFVIKKDGTSEPFDATKIVNAVKKSATRALVELSEEDLKSICDFVNNNIIRSNKDEVSIAEMHNLVESALEHLYPQVASSYRNYRNYKQDFVHMLDKVYQESQRIMYIGDKENSNTDSALVSTKRSLIFNQLNKELYQKFFLTTEELQACREGYIYIHDMSARRDTMNCCLFDVATVLKGGFEMGNLWYNEPKSLDVAFDVIGDIVMAAASQQYGGFTVPEVDKILAPYAEKTYERQYNKYLHETLDSIPCGIAQYTVDDNYGTIFANKECLRLYGYVDVTDMTIDQYDFFSLEEISKILSISVEQSKEYYQQSLAILKQVYGESHPIVATSYNNIGSIFDKQGDYAHALEYYQKTLGRKFEVSFNPSSTIIQYG